MDHLSFFPFHNRHIKFFYDGHEMYGVVIDSIPYNEKSFSTQYVYIPSNKLREWKEAEDNHDKTRMKLLEQEIDILKISDPSLIVN